MASSEKIESLVPVRRVVQHALGRPVESWLLVDRKDLQNSLTIQHNMWISLFGVK